MKSTKEKQEKKEEEDEELEFTPEASVKIPREEKCVVEFDNTWPYKGLILRIRITRAGRSKSEIEMTKEDAKTRCGAAYPYLRKVLPAARKKASSLPENSSIKEEADEILRKMISFMEERGLPIS